MEIPSIFEKISSENIIFPCSKLTPPENIIKLTRNISKENMLLNEVLTYITIMSPKMMKMYYEFDGGIDSQRNEINSLVTLVT